MALAGCGGGGGHGNDSPPPVEELTPPSITLPQASACPASITTLPANVTCWTGRDENDAYFWVVKPADWNGKLVIHAHGGPSLGAVTEQRAIDDLDRWTVWIRAGYAFAVTSYKQGGVAVLSAAEDMAVLLPIAVGLVGKPDKVILHGQSWGAGVAARAAEVDSALSKVKPKVDAVLLTSGVLGGGTKSYDFRLDIRVVYQALCKNHPRPAETQYPLWQGLPTKDSTLSPNISSRINECLGLNKPFAQRTPEQQQKSTDIVNVIKIPENQIQSHLNWGTNHFQDIVFNRLNGRNPFRNDSVYYMGSHDDAWLNAEIDAMGLRYAADLDAVMAFAKDADPTGDIAMPIMTLRWIDDPTAFVELANTWENTVNKAGRSANLRQLYARSPGKTHSYLSDAEYIAVMEALLDWEESGNKPSALDVAQRCAALDAKWTPGSCAIDPSYEPQPLSTRVPAR
ncbi:MAG: hypothetical protein LBI87_06855 [Candidatus Accumulibacter sp.]|nr:hypothetical protein [Accumulibacter sp.]